MARRDPYADLNPDLDEIQLDDAYYEEIGMTREEAMRQQRDMLYNIDPDASVLDDIGKVDESLPEEWRSAIESLEVYGPQALIMAGFRAEEYAVARTTLDQLGADQIKVLPATEEMLQGPLDLALATPEVDWSAPRPPAWILGGAWGSQRTIMFSGLSLKAQATILEYLEAQGLPPVCVTMALREDGTKTLGTLLAAAVQAQRNMKAPNKAPWEVPRQAAAAASSSGSSSSSSGSSSGSSSTTTRRGIDLSSLPGKRGPLFSRPAATRTCSSSSSSSRRLSVEGLDDLQDLITPEMARQRLRVDAADLSDELADVIDMEITDEYDNEPQQQQQRQRQQQQLNNSGETAAAAAGSSSSVPYDTDGLTDEAKAMLEWFHNESTGETVELPYLEDEPAATAAAAAAMGVGAAAGSSRAAALGLDIALDDLLPSRLDDTSSSSSTPAAAAAELSFTGTGSSSSSRLLDPSNVDDEEVSVFAAIQSALKSGVDPAQLKQLIDAAAAASAAAKDPVDLLLNEDAAMQRKMQQTSKALWTAAAQDTGSAGHSSSGSSTAAAAAGGPKPQAEFGPETPPVRSVFGKAQKPGAFDSDPLLKLRPEIERAFHNDQIKFVDMNKMPKKYKQRYTQDALAQRMQQQQQKYMQQQQELEQQQQQQQRQDQGSSSSSSSSSDKQRWWQQQRSPQQQQFLQGLASGVAGKLPGGGRVVEMEVAGGIPDLQQQQQQQYMGQEQEGAGEYVDTSATAVTGTNDSGYDSNGVANDDGDDDTIFEDAELVGESEEDQQSLWFSASQLQDLVDSARAEGLDPTRALAQAIAFGVQVEPEVAATVGVGLPNPDLIESARKDIIGSIREMQASEGLQQDGAVVLAEDGYQGFLDTSGQGGSRVDDKDQGLAASANPAGFRGAEVAAVPVGAAEQPTGSGRVWGSGISTAVNRAKARLAEKKRQQQQEH